MFAVMKEQEEHPASQGYRHNIFFWDFNAFEFQQSLADVFGQSDSQHIETMPFNVYLCFWDLNPRPGNGCRRRTIRRQRGSLRKSFVTLAIKCIRND